MIIQKSTYTILLFIVCSILGSALVLVAGSDPQPAENQVALEAPDSLVTSDQEASTLYVYYFHGRKRCRSCRTIEGYTHDVILTKFPELLESGQMIWETINFVNPEFEHYKTDFELITQSVVLVERKNNEIIRWKNLKDVWLLLRKKDEFYQYVQTEINDFLKQG